MGDEYHSYASVQQTQHIHHVSVRSTPPARQSEHMRRFEVESRDLEHWVTVLEDGLRQYGGPMDTKTFRQSMAEARNGHPPTRALHALTGAPAGKECAQRLARTLQDNKIHIEV